MTTPGGVPNLPLGALTPENIVSRVEDMTGGAMRSRAAERFPSIMGGSSGGTPLSDFTPFGILTRIWAEFNSAVANADPADINGPEDLPELLLEFIENLPVVGEFVGLLEAILGTYDGDDPTLLQIQALFGFLRSDGMIDASKLFGELPAVMLQAILSLASGGLLGNVELGQLWRPAAGEERNWLEPFDTVDSIKTDTDPNWSWDGVAGRTAPGSAKCTLDGSEHVQTSEPIEAAPGQTLDIGARLRWDDFTGTGGAAFILRVLAYNAGDQLLGSQVIGSVTPSGADAPDFEAGMSGTWAPPTNTAYVRVRMECTAAGTGGTVHWDDLWLRKPAQNLPQEWVAGLVEDLGNLFGWIEAWVQHGLNALGIPIVGDLFSQITDLANGFGGLQTDSDATRADLDDLVGGLLSDPVSVIGEIPQSLVGGLPTALGNLLPKADWTTFLTGLGNSAGTGAGGSTGFPDMDDALDWIGNLFGKADNAQTSATAAHTTAKNAAASSLALMQLEEGEWKLTKQQWTPGTYTWTVNKTPSAGYEIIGYDLITVAGGDSGSVPRLRTEGPPGGLGGGYRRKRIPLADMPNSVTVEVGAGGPAKTSSGRGNPGGVTRFVGLCESPQPGQSVIDTIFGDTPCADRPGRGGDGGGIQTYETSSGSDAYNAYSGQDGENSLEAQGGALGAAGASGWFGNSVTNPTAGGSPTQPADDIRCGAGGGGAPARTAAAPIAGAPGGDPGGGGGASGSWSSNLYGPAASGPGGPGRAAAIKVERKLPA
ncbi:glycine-rich domain-containing protein [Tsukamurella sp. 1534]|uniref:glycine-rich domain-containing protein n=1 Tax=Tsukamurella sp. 1534 TaxID=1151061 RepID=UPI0002F20940|nr:hypothetical protein [Tsukamurella sp. 1534]